MTFTEEPRGHRDIALACATALEATLGNDTPLTVGQAQVSLSDVLRLETARAVASALASGDATVVLFVAEAFATTLEHAASDELLLTAAAPAVIAMVGAVAALAGADSDQFSGPRELPSKDAVDALGSDIAVFPLLETTEVVACVAVSLAATGAPETTTHASSHAASTTSARANAVVVPGASSLVLADVEMGVTAELGRSHMSVREVLSLTPGAVIDLDRAAGAPVDLLVNGKAIARGEVVIVDEEFGIRITEILSNQGSS
jgi:flagellar motor switch protein FliN